MMVAFSIPFSSLNTDKPVCGTALGVKADTDDLFRNPQGAGKRLMQE